MSFVATTSVRKLVLLLLASAAFVAIGIWMVRSPRADHPDTVGGWLGIGLFGLCAVTFLVQLITPRQRLTIDSYGVTLTQRRPRSTARPKVFDGDVYITLKPLDRSVKDVMSAVDQYWPPRER